MVQEILKFSFSNLGAFSNVSFMSFEIQETGF
jgi:hypothetical protein